MAFNVRKHLIQVRGGRHYLPVAARVAWFRDEHPDWSIETHPLHTDLEQGVAVFQAVVKDVSGRVIASATKMETRTDFPDYLEKAETGAVGRALALCGYGTQFAPELSEGSVDGEEIAFADSPLPLGNDQPQPEALVCENCGHRLTRSQYTLSMNKFQRALCPRCQRQVQSASSI
ncbi:MAG: hypothetical protein SNJ72_03240 [Fimbriimonadales bacterium]